MFKFISSVFIILLITAGVFYFASEKILTPIAQRAFERAAEEVKDLGGEIQEPSLESAKWQFPAAIEIQQIGAKLILSREDSDIPSSLGLKVKKLVFKLADFDDRLIGVKIEGIEISFPLAEESNTGHQKIEALANLNLRLDFTEPSKAAAQAKIAIKDILTLITEGFSKTPIDFQGNASFLLNGAAIQGRLHTDRQVERSVLIMDKEDLRNFVSSHLAEQLTDSEIDLISNYPLRAPRLLKIRDDAELKARAAKGQNPNVPEDAYRHVLWAYLLTKAYGEVFSKQVTDAHERKIAGTNPENDRRMDLNNNALGRRYALVGFEESSLLDMLMQDARAVKNKTDVKEETAAEEDKALQEKEEEEEDTRPVNVLGEIGT